MTDADATLTLAKPGADKTVAMTQGCWVTEARDRFGVHVVVLFTEEHYARTWLATRGWGWVGTTSFVEFGEEVEVEPEWVDD